MLPKAIPTSGQLDDLDNSGTQDFADNSDGNGSGPVLSLFQNDPLSRLLRKVHIDSSNRSRPVVRIASSVVLTWGMLAVLAAIKGVALRASGLPAESFLKEIGRAHV